MTTKKFIKKDGVPRTLRKRIKGTNIVVQKNANDGIVDEHQALLHSIQDDDPVELMWFHNTLRPEKRLIHPAEAFLQGIKTLRPALNFHTFDLAKSKLRRLAKQEKDKMTALERRKQRVAPAAALKAALNPHRIPRTGTEVPDDEARFLSRGKVKKNKKHSRANTTSNSNKNKTSSSSSSSSKSDKGNVKYFTKWRKKKAERIGKGL